MRTDALDYELPEGLIATQAAEPRDSARLMVCDRVTGAVRHSRVSELPGLGVLRAGDVMVVNRSKVFRAYLEGVRRGTGGRVTGLFLGDEGGGEAGGMNPPAKQGEVSWVGWRVMLRSGGRLVAGDVVELGGVALVLEEGLGGGAWRVRVEGDEGVVRGPGAAVLERVGGVPLPPYIRQARRKRGEAEEVAGDGERYNTVYAEGGGVDHPAEAGWPEARMGSVAAPTAGLHFTPGLLEALAGLGVERAEVTLHVGTGTFLPVKSEALEEHPMHSEPITVPSEALATLRRVRAGGGKVLAVGTTSVRTLESLPAEWASLERDYSAETGLFIRPDAGFEFRFTDMLLTNFHLPKSTLLALVAALPGVGVERLLGWYREAVAEGYRFYSYGDAMLVV
ncbi:MAG: S-adenosylmethionine:tRNA ribosyltransferase-isomerase [Planctomycetota bacterium]